MIVLQYLVDVIAVEKLLLETEVQHLHVGITVETRDLLTEAAVEYAVLKGDDHIVIRLEALEQVSIHAGDIVRVDEGRLYAGLFLDERRRLLAERVERTQTDNSDRCALLLNLVGVQPAEVLVNSLSVGNKRAARHTDNDRVLVLLNAPVEHRQIFFLGSRRQINQVGDVCQHRNVVQTEMRYIVHAVNRAPCNDNGSRVAVDAQVLRNLVISALNERAVYAVDRLAAVCRNAGRQRNRILLGDAYVDKLFAGLLAHLLGEAKHGRRTRGNHAHRWVSLHLLHHEIKCDALVALAAHVHQRLAGLRMERRTVVPCLLVQLGRRVALALLGDDVHNNRLPAVLYGRKCLDKRSNIVAVGYKAVIQTHRTEQIAFCLAARLAQQAQVLIQTAVILRDGHIVVVDEDDQVAVQLRRVVERLERFAAAERTVANDGNHVVVLTLEVAALGQAAGQTDRGGGVADGEMVVLAFVRIAVAGNVVVVLRVEKGVLAAGQNLVRIGLVGNVEYKLVLRGLEYIVQCNRRLYHAEIRTEMAAVTAQLGQQCVTHFGRKHGHLLNVQLLHVSGTVDVLDIHSFPPECFFLNSLYHLECAPSQAVLRKIMKKIRAPDTRCLNAQIDAENASPFTVQCAFPSCTYSSAPPRLQPAFRKTAVPSGFRR